ncbi:hypothetical protein [uncultured Prevotella sp.]|uniref:hypothetical protein n=1 Tax=uncultured Prevotella sp. TaxID=159272 RepID=UPI0025E46CE2|nr:hypothetical protein [uncultured Prevotella sp.]
MRKTLLSIAFALFGAMAVNAQYVSDPTENTKVTESIDNYGNDAVVSKDGILYSVQQVPNHDDDGTIRLAYNLQILDKNGNRLFPDGGVTICNEENLSYTVVNDVLYADNDGNCLVMVSDCRNSPKDSRYRSYTIYKYGPDGKMLWDSGVNMADDIFGCDNALLNVTQVADGGYVFAYESFNEETNSSYVRIEKITSDGKKAWSNPVELKDSKTPYSCPFVVDAGDSQFMLIYAKSSNEYIMAQLYDFDGTPLWDEELKVYVGGFDSTPLYTKLKVFKAPEGAFVTWSDDRYAENVFSNYISYVKRDGTLAFPGGTNALKISYANDFSRQVPMLVYNDADKCVYAIYRQYDQGMQTYCGIYMQKIGLDGELKWGPEGKPIVAMQNDRSVGYATVQNATDSDIAVFYQTNKNSGGDVKTYVMKMDKDGNNLWENAVEPCTVVSEKNDLLSSSLIDDKYWILTWGDMRISPDYFSYGMYAQRVNVDGTLGNVDTGIDNASVASGADDDIAVYGIDGCFVKAGKKSDCVSGLRSGIYIVKDKVTGTTAKMTVK